MHNLFVYGTLKKGEVNHKRFGLNLYKRISSKSKIKGISLVQRKTLPYPFAIKEDSGEVFGEVYSVDSKMLKYLTEIERNAGYTRVKMADSKNNFVYIFINTGYNYPRLKRFSNFKGVR